MDTAVMKDFPTWIVMFLIMTHNGTPKQLMLVKFVVVMDLMRREVESTVLVSVLKEELEITGVLVVEKKLFIIMIQVYANVKNGCQLLHMMTTISYNVIAIQDLM
jgi:hypothetical protein